MCAAQFETKHIVAGGFNTRYLEAGDRTKPTLILIHDGAFGTTAELCWNGILGALSRDYRLLAPELLGWGGTDKVVYFDRSPYAARIPHIAAFVRQVGVESADYLGVSFGGSLIMRATVAPAIPGGSAAPFPCRDRADPTGCSRGSTHCPTIRPARKRRPSSPN
jgi:hypothetical protein